MARNLVARRRRYPLWRLLRANAYDFGLLLRESWIALLGFVLVALVGTLYLWLRYPGAARPAGPAEALYQTLALMTLQSGLAFPSGDLLGTLLFFLIPLLGLALIFQSVLNFGRLLLDKGSRREQWQIALASTYSDHVIICGLGRVSVRVIDQLIAAGRQVVVIERDWSSEFVDRTISLKVPVVLGDAREPATLRRAGVMRARAVVAAVSDDLLNIEAGLNARALRPDIRVVLRIFSEELDQNLERSFGSNSAFSASALAAPTFAAAAVSRDIDFVLPVSATLVGVSHLTVQPDSLLSGFVNAVEESYHIRVLTHYDAEGNPLRRTLLRPLSSGDRVLLLGTLDAIEALREKNRRGSKLGMLAAQQLRHPTAIFDTVIVCGLGKVGYRVVRQLHRLTPRPRIVVVCKDDTDPLFAARIDQLDGVTVVIGDARNREVLQHAGVEQAYSVAALTSDDSTNLQIGLAARRMRPDVHIVLRVFSDALADRLAEMFGIRTAYSTSALAGATLAAAAAIGGIRHAFLADGRLFATDRIQVVASSILAGASVASLREQYGVLVIGLRRNDQPQPLPPPDLLLTTGDTITLLAAIDQLARLRMLLRQAPASTNDGILSASERV